MLLLLNEPSAESQESCASERVNKDRTTGGGTDFTQVAMPRERSSSGKLIVPLYIALRVRELKLDIVNGEIHVGLRVFGFWSRKDCEKEWPEGDEFRLDASRNVLGEPVGHPIPNHLDEFIPTISVAGKVRSEEQQDESGLREIKHEGNGMVHTTAPVAKFWHGVVTMPEPDCMVTMMQYRTAAQTFDLRKFPFDRQTIRLNVRLPKANAKDSHFNFIVDEQLEVPKERITPKRQRSPQGASDSGPLEITDEVRKQLSEEWEILSTNFREVPNEDNTSCKSAKVELVVKRKPAYYLTRMFLPSGVCASLSMTAWNLPNTMFEDRAAILVTLFLALVASQTSYSTNLPKLPYMTVLDEYMTACMAFCSLVLVGCVIGSPRRGSYGYVTFGRSANSSSDDDTSGGGIGGVDHDALVMETIDLTCMIVLAAGWLAYNASFYLNHFHRGEGHLQVGRMKDRTPVREVDTPATTSSHVELAASSSSQASTSCRKGSISDNI